MLDGETDLPPFIVAPDPDPDDRQFREEKMEMDWFPENHHNRDSINGVISGALHEHFYKKKSG